MTTKQETVDFICEQSGLSQRVSARTMFGEFALYVDGKVIGLVCDNTLYVKPTEPGRSILGTTVDRAPYKGAKPHFCISKQLEDRELVPESVTAIGGVQHWMPMAGPGAAN